MQGVIQLAEVIRRTGKSCSSIYSDILKGLFPRPVKTGQRGVGWIDEEINRWLLRKMRERDRRFGKQFSIASTCFDRMAKSPSVIRLPAVIRLTGKSRSSIYADIRKRLFPRQVRIGVHSSGWIFEEIDLWIAHQIRERDLFLRQKFSPLRERAGDTRVAGTGS